MRCKTRENPGTVLLLKLPIQGRDGEDKREEAEGRWSTEGLCVWPGADAGAAVDPLDAPHGPFLWGRRRCPQEYPQLCFHSDLFLLLWCLLQPSFL